MGDHQVCTQSPSKVLQGSSLISHIGPIPLTGAEYGGSWSGTIFGATRKVLGHKNTMYYQYSLQTN